MIFSRVIEHVKQQHWTGALIELVIVILGVFIGLQANNWNATRVSSQNERFVLREMRSDLLRDSAEVDMTLRHYRFIDADSTKLLHDLKTGKAYTPTMDKEFGRVYAFVLFELQTDGYESLKSQGMDLIRNPSLRTQISKMYEMTYPALEREGKLSRHYFLYVLQPYFLVHFKDLHVTRSATPLDYAAVAHDPYFFNIIAFHRDIARDRYIPSFKHASASTHHLIASIDKQLDIPVPKRSHPE